jgi:SAM-dependent methyltransferase
MRSESGENWKNFGKNDPYFGVLSDEKFRLEKLSEETLAEFFQTGEAYVNQTRKRIQTIFGKDLSGCSILDFGCGVGRLSIPFARLTTKDVCGIDISEDIIKRAIAHQSALGLKNLVFKSYDGLHLNREAAYDFINSYIVFQHIEPSKGMVILKQLFQSLNPGGILHVQITYGHRLPLASYINFYLRTNFRPYNFVYSSLKHRRFSSEATMQMNHYDPKKLFDLFSKFSDRVHVEFTDHGGHLGAFYMVKKT